MIEKTRKKRNEVSKEEYLGLCSENLSEDQYLHLETLRKGKDWSELILKQSYKCYYCEIDIRSIQKLVLNGIIGLRRRGPDGYSGMHFEIDHKNANNKDNNPQNMVAACYYCNNDKSNTISERVFKDYFGPQRGVAFQTLIKEKNIRLDEFFWHNLYFKHNRSV